ncbi:MAG: putative ABC transporter permease [bacterium]|nr:putative ABC transporter permease [bacterium]
MTMYHMINWFFALSFFGYVLECVVLSLENHKLVLDRGFGHGPFCIIYGFGAAFACLMLEPFVGQPLRLYFASMLLATSMEMVTAGAMIYLFGEFWWNYSEKPFNYKGIICLESSIGWGFLGLVFFGMLNRTIHALVALIPQQAGKILAVSLVLFYLSDFVYCVHQRLSGQEEVEEGEESIGRMKVSFRGR